MTGRTLKTRKRTKPLRWERRPDERPRELLEAALDVFAQRGYRNTRLDDVAEAAGVTKGAIYHYFDTKEDLLLGVIEHHQALAFGRVEDVLSDKTQAPSTRIRLVVRRIFSGGAPRGRRLLALLVRGIAHEVPEVHARWLEQGPARLWTIVAELVKEGKASGEFRADADAEVAARLLVSGLMLQLMWRQHGDAIPAIDFDETRLVESAVELFLAALR
jgi:AcrR family transcriptional regulator